MYATTSLVWGALDGGSGAPIRPIDVDAVMRFAAERGHPILITGETGSGKTFLARRLHEIGPRSGGPMIQVNCASIPEPLFEREMFGHVRGAYTDAREPAPGFVQVAHGGTLFLDEVGDLPLPVQSKLLSFLDDGVFRRLGSTAECRSDVQVITATNRDLEALVRRGGFRTDLFYRISVVCCTVLPLRQRRDEIPAFARELLRRAGGGEEPPPLSPSVVRALRAYDWPGNIRELDNVLRAASIFALGGPIEERHLPPGMMQDDAGGQREAAPTPERYTAPADPNQEVRRIERALAEAGGNRTRAARRLGMARSTLWAKLHRYGIAAPPWSASAAD